MNNRRDNRSRRAPSSELPAPTSTTKSAPASAIRRHRGDFTWTGVRTEPYKKAGEDWTAISRKVLAGTFGEKAKFHVRYVEIAPNGYSSLEAHRHEHVVICIRGKGRIVLGTKSHALKPFDVAYVAPDEVHQLRNPYAEAFGFLCMVDARRDRPRPVAAPRRAPHASVPSGSRKNR